ncbi:GYDIA family GHMP kinase [Capnocytophaga gingivalis]|uniref:GYDIA family GHMP kinase n=1 Tax=Capnocytophaga gingivalis TaxID=1017 RepID=UPI0028D58127|nr:GYDIA family GHMP kinase [Capnocytophaga gingivalis]
MEKGNHFFAHGKLLLTGEYAVLDGALAIALPTQYGQEMHITPSEKEGIFFRSLTQEGTPWYEGQLFVGDTNPITQTLERILSQAQRMQPNFLTDQSVHVQTRLDFPREWGLGSSSTLISMIAQWAEVDPYQLLWNSFGGSGYDIACARASSPILYQLTEGKAKVYPIYYNPPFAASLFFVYLNKKQNSREGIALYEGLKKNKKPLVTQLSQLTEEIYRTHSLDTFSKLLSEHEAVLSSYLRLTTVKDSLFKDFSGTIKSLGAWGGDFVLAIGEESYIKEYFISKGMQTILPFAQIILPTDREPILPPAHQAPR